MRNLQNIVITKVDRARLQTVIDRALEHGNESRPYVVDLQRELDRAEVVDPASAPSGLVVMNSTVCLRDLDSNESETYVLVYPRDADISCNRISVLAPVGTAIIGCQVGDVVTWSVPRGRVQLRIEDVIPPGPPQGEPVGALLCQTQG